MFPQFWPFTDITMWQMWQKGWKVVEKKHCVQYFLGTQSTVVHFCMNWVICHFSLQFYFFIYLVLTSTWIAVYIKSSFSVLCNLASFYYLSLLEREISSHWLSLGLLQVIACCGFQSSHPLRFQVKRPKWKQLFLLFFIWCCFFFSWSGTVCFGLCSNC